MDSELTWGVQQRLEFIEFRLYWENSINRADIINRFGVSVPQASKDLSQYQTLAPGNAIYDKSAKRYTVGPEFAPKFLVVDAAQYLSQLRLLTDGTLSAADTWLGAPSDIGLVGIPQRSVSAPILQTVLTAIRGSQEIEVRYQSMSHEQPRWRWIGPHALGFDGFRWHVRAFCDIDQVFKDFVLSRVLEVRSSRPQYANRPRDTDWHEYVDVEIAPHPELSPAQQRAVELDYAMRDGRAVIQVRRALLFYTLKRLGLDVDATARDPQDQQIVLLGKNWRVTR
jgi:hypothetical protein